MDMAGNPMHNAGSRMSSAMPAVDVLRAIAAISVALFHFNELPAARAPDQLLLLWKAFWKFGHLGVPAFFVLSGYCIGLTWLRETSAARFASRRAARIFPAYWASLALITVLAVARKMYTGTNDVARFPASFEELAATLSILTYPASAVATVNWVYWSLSYELVFYALMFSLLLIPDIARRTKALVTGSNLLCLWAIWIPPAKPSWLFFVDLWPLFAAGLAIAMFPARRSSSYWLAAGPALYFLAQLAWDGAAGYAVVGIATAGIVCASLGQRFTLAALAPLGKVGEFSYSLYLIHVPIGCHMVARVIPVTDHRAWISIPVQLFALLLVLLCSWAFWRMFEHPFFVRRSGVPVSA